MSPLASSQMLLRPEMYLSLQMWPTLQMWMGWWFWWLPTNNERKEEV